MTIPNTDRSFDAMRTLLMIRNTWDPRLREIVRGLIHANIRRLRETASSA